LKVIWRLSFWGFVHFHLLHQPISIFPQIQCVYIYIYISSIPFISVTHKSAINLLKFGSLLFNLELNEHTLQFKLKLYIWKGSWNIHIYNQTKQKKENEIKSIGKGTHHTHTQRTTTSHTKHKLGREGSAPVTSLPWETDAAVWPSLPSWLHRCEETEHQRLGQTTTRKEKKSYNGNEPGSPTAVAHGWPSSSSVRSPPAPRMLVLFPLSRSSSWISRFVYSKISGRWIENRRSEEWVSSKQ